MNYIIIALFSFSNHARSLTTLKFKSKYDQRHLIWGTLAHPLAK
jgi:hypothetical protein